MSSKHLCLLVLALALVLGTAAAFLAPLNQDEGWYLLSAQRVAQGQVPYRDFAFTQAPLLPYVYQGALPLVERFGVAGGRLFSLLLALLTLGIVVRFSFREGGFPAAGIAAALLGVNLFHAQYTATVKTYGFAGLALALATAAWILYSRDRRYRLLVLCAIALAFAAATRFSLLLFFAPLGLSLLPLGASKSHRPWLVFSIAGLLALALLYGPFLVAAPEGLAFGLVRFHAGRLVSSPLLLKAGFLSRVLQSYFPAALGIGLLLLRRKPLLPGMKALAAALAAVSLLHLLAPFPYDDYQAALYPALVLLLALELPRRFSEKDQPYLALATATICLAATLSSPQLPTWFSHRQDRIWWRMKDVPDLVHLRETAQLLRSLKPDAKLLLTFDTYLAVEARMDVPHGLEMGPFSYFPDMSDDQAKRLRVLNRQGLQDILESTPAPLAAFSGYAFAIASPGITEIDSFDQHLNGRQALLQRFTPSHIVHNFGQGSTTLEIFRLTEPEEKN